MASPVRLISDWGRQPDCVTGESEEDVGCLHRCSCAAASSRTAARLRDWELPSRSREKAPASLHLGEVRNLPGPILVEWGDSVNKGTKDRLNTGWVDPRVDEYLSDRLATKRDHLEVSPERGCCRRDRKGYPDSLRDVGRLDREGNALRALFVNVSFGCSEFAHGSDHRHSRPGFEPSRSFCLHSSAHRGAPVTWQESTEAEALVVWRVPRNVSECGQRHGGESAFPCPRVSEDNQLRSDSLTRMLRVDRDLLNMGSSVNLLEEQVGDDHSVDEPDKRSMVRDEALKILPADRLIIGDYRHIDVAEQHVGGSLDLGDLEVVLETGKTSHRSILPLQLRTYRRPKDRPASRPVVSRLTSA